MLLILCIGVVAHLVRQNRETRQNAANSRDRAAYDLSLLTHQHHTSINDRVQPPRSDDLCSLPDSLSDRRHAPLAGLRPAASLPPGPPSSSAASVVEAGWLAAENAAVREVVVVVETAMSATITEVEQRHVDTLMDETELVSLINEMPDPEPPEAGVDEAAGLGEQPQGQRQRQVASDEALGGGSPQSCSSPGPSVDAPSMSIEDSWRARAALQFDELSSIDMESANRFCMTKASPVLAAAHAHRTSEKLGRLQSHACKNCKAAKVTCANSVRPCVRCVRLGLPCQEAAKLIKHACTNCCRSRVRCDLEAGNNPCSRCRRLDLVCEPVDHMTSHERRNQKKRGSPSSGDDDAQAGTTGNTTPDPASS